MNDKIKDIDVYIETYIHKFINFLPSLISALVILLLGIWIIRFIRKIVKRFFQNRHPDPTLEKFISSLIEWSLRILLFVLVVTQLGVESASLVAIIGAAGLTIGLALQGSLANFAGGVLILVLRPFKVGDWISAQGVEGTVSEISIFNTRITTFGNQVAVIPNGKLSNDKVVNYNALNIRRKNFTFRVGYDDDIKKAKEILLKIVMEQETVIKEEGKMPMVAVAALNDNSVDLTLRYWASNADFWDLHFYVLEEVKNRFDAAGIVIPYPQRVVHFPNKM